MVDTTGVKKFTTECDNLAQKYGAGFAVPNMLRDKAAKDEKFYV